jgi:peptidoglycan/xylan/chitin deacetylase (PgdA/CDA1 family)
MKKPPAKKKPPKKKSAKKVVKTPLAAAKPITPVVQPKTHLTWPRFDFGFVLVLSGVLILAALTLNLVTASTQRDKQRQLDAISLSDQASETHLFYTKQFKPLLDDLQTFQSKQTTASLEIVDQTSIGTRVATIKKDLQSSKLHEASSATASLRKDLTGWQKTLSARLTTAQLKQAPAVTIFKSTGPFSRQYEVPIMIYHKTPNDFEQQLLVLQKHGYTTITLAQLVAAWNGGALPAKPAIITFDDGFADQMTAFSLLQKYKMKATFYIIDGGTASNWCIGANRRYNDPGQPTTGCGDDYLSWDQIRQLDQSGLITIGAHTIDHPDLTTETATQQRTEIIGGKTQLEAQLGHSVTDFAYPYGSYNATTISIVEQAGFTTAVTTAPGTLQSASNRYALTRIRSTYSLP